MKEEKGLRDESLMPLCLNVNVNLRKARLRWVHKLRREALGKEKEGTLRGSKTGFLYFDKRNTPTS